MIIKETFTEEHIRALQSTSHRDPALLERAVFAFGLLEALRRVGMPLIFKGGTSSILMLEPPRRLSTDVDIVVEPGTDVDGFIKEASKIFPFRAAEEQIRVGKNKIEKRHFKFTYDSVVQDRTTYILLDVLFEHSHYGNLVNRAIKNELLLTEPEFLTVSTPSPDCILADKLTAFAPHTTGISLNAGKDMEVIKQFYDVCSLLDVFTDQEAVLHTYQDISAAEAAYRGIESTPQDCLMDSFDSALCIASRGKTNADEYPIYVKGIRDVRDHIYAENFTSEIAAGRAAKVMYMIACLLYRKQYTSVADYTEYAGEKIQSKNLMPVRYLRKVNPEAYAYVIKTDRVMNGQ